ncbi:MAG: hypothetical protein ABWY05_08545 [Noviherbaspirillum sp.]
MQPQTAGPAPRRASSPPLLQSLNASRGRLLGLQAAAPAPHRAASRPRWQQSFGPSALARHHLGAAIVADNWHAFEATRAAHPQFSFCGSALLRLAAQAGAIAVASGLQCQGVDPFGPDAAATPFYAALRRGDGELASQMLAFRLLVARAAVPDLRPYLAAALDHGAAAAITLLLRLSVQLGSLMPFELLAQAIAADNARRIALLIAQPSMALALQSLKAERTLIHFAIAHGSAATLALLLARVRGPERAARLCAGSDSAGGTALDRAVASGDLEKLRLIQAFNPGVAAGAGAHAQAKDCG